MKTEKRRADKLIEFLYILLRDHLTSGVVEGIMQHHLGKFPLKDKIFTNCYVLNHAEDIAIRIRESVFTQKDDKVFCDKCDQQLIPVISHEPCDCNVQTKDKDEINKEDCDDCSNDKYCYKHMSKAQAQPETEELIEEIIKFTQFHNDLNYVDNFRRFLKSKLE